tara:strand:+ start:2112 stop:2855 length:744 start_codon:yes stop_codon:yes gene_type:complete
MSNDYFKPRVSYYWNEPITFGISLSNRTKDFGKTKVLGWRKNIKGKGKYEYVWANPIKAGLPKNLHLKDIRYGYVPSGESSTTIRWLDEDVYLDLAKAKYIVFNGRRIRKAVYDELYDPHTKQYPQTIVNIKYNNNLQMSLPNIVERLKRIGEWNDIGNKRITSHSIKKFHLWDWIASFHQGQSCISLRQLRQWGSTLKIPKKAIAMSMHSMTQDYLGFAGESRFDHFACLFREGQSSNLKPMNMVL